MKGIGTAQSRTTRFACPKCDGATIMEDCKPIAAGIRRRRRCIDCRERFVTIESALAAPPEPVRAVAWAVEPAPSISPPCRPSMRAVARDMAARHGLTFEMLTGREGPKRLGRIRQEAYAEVRRLTGKSLPQIGQLFGDRDHTTILLGIRRHEARLLRESSPVESIQG